MGDTIPIDKVDKNRERLAYRKLRNLVFKSHIKLCAGCHHHICRCDDRRRRYEIDNKC